jgi:hypothetical protein
MIFLEPFDYPEKAVPQTQRDNRDGRENNPVARAQASIVAAVIRHRHRRSERYSHHTNKNGVANSQTLNGPGR